jgi:NTE family protein
VLSGGGARGFAHIGALAALERLRVPIDCIVGTSMGAVVGGLYASGLSADAIGQRFAAMDWSRLADDRVDRQELRLQQKAIDYDYPFGFEWGLKDGTMRLPAGVVGGSRFEMTLREWLQPVLGVRDFDQLPIPFRSVSTDLETGNEVVFSNGRLFEAIRASMSVPGLFSPVEMNGRLLADGGLVKNLPIDVARALGADVIIAVNIGSTLSRRSQLGDLVGVYQQMINILTEQNVINQIKQLQANDILITPDLKDFSFLDFAGALRLISLGDAAVIGEADRLTKHSASVSEYAAWRESRRTPTGLAALAVNKITITPLERVNPAVVADAISTREGGPFDAASVRRDLRKIEALGDFERVDAILDPHSGGLTFVAREKSWGPNFFRFGLDLSTDFRGEGRFGLAVGYTRTWMNSLGAFWRNDLRIGFAQGLRSEFVQPLSATARYYVAPTYSYERRPVDFYLGDERALRLDVQRQVAGVRVGAPVGTWGEVRMGVGEERSRIVIATGGPLLDLISSSAFPREFKERYTGLIGEVIADQLDHAYFPKSGYRLDINGFVATQQPDGRVPRYTLWSADAIGARTFGTHTVNVRFKAGSVKSSAGVTQRFTLGGFQELSGLSSGQLAGDHLLFGRLIYYWPFSTVDLFGRRAYIGSSIEAGNVWEVKPDKLRWSNLRKAGSVFMGVETPLGPMYLGLGRAGKDNTAVYLFLGRP